MVINNSNIQQEEECQDCKKFTWQQKMVIGLSAYVFVSSVVGTFAIVKFITHLF